MADLQRDAIEAIVRDAVEESGGRPGMVIGEYIVLAAANGWDADGAEITQVVMIPDGPESRVLGLIEHARVQLHSIVSGYGD